MTTNSSSDLVLPEYRKVIFLFSAWLRKFKDIADTLDLDSISLTIQETLSKVENSNFSIAVVGEFKRGKSSLINALLSQKILPVDILPTTATLNRIKYGIELQVQIHFNNGEIKNIDPGELSQYITKLTPESTKVADSVKEAVIYYPISYCRNDVDIIDTPGLQDEVAMTAVTLSTLPKVDAAIFVTMALAPLSQSEEAFLSENLLNQNIGRILFVVNGIDRCQNIDDANNVIQRVKEKIKKIIILKAEKKFDPSSVYYKQRLTQLAQLEVIGISAKQALQAKINDDPDLLSQSHFPELEMALEKLLEEKGKLFLQVSIERILSLNNHILTEIATQRFALEERQITLANNYALSVSILNEESIKQKDYFTQYQNLKSDTQHQISILLEQLKNDLQDDVSSILNKISSALITGERSHILERLKRLDSRVIEVLENRSRRWAGTIQVKIRRSIANIPEVFRPEQEQLLQWMNSVGLYGVDFGRSINQQVSQVCVASELYDVMEKSLAKQSFIEQFRHRYTSYLETIISQQFEDSATSRHALYDQLVQMFSTLLPESLQSEEKERWLITKRLKLAREETRIELAMQDLKEIEREVEEIKEAANFLKEQLTDSLSNRSETSSK